MEALAVRQGVHHPEDRPPDGDRRKVSRLLSDFTQTICSLSTRSPIVTWLPNQLFAVMDLMNSIWGNIADADKQGQPQFVFDMMSNVADQQVKLKREVERWCQERGVEQSA